MNEPSSFQKTLLLIIGSLIAIGMTIQIGFMLMSYRYANNSLAEAQENKVRLREYEMEMGAPKIGTAYSDPFLFELSEGR